jgi:hypothetical protein
MLLALASAVFIGSESLVTRDRILLYLRNGSWSSLYRSSTDRTENLFSIIACSLVAGETICPQSCSLAEAVVLSPVYIACTWQRVYMSRYFDLKSAFTLRSVRVSVRPQQKGPKAGV